MGWRFLVPQRRMDLIDYIHGLGVDDGIKHPLVVAALTEALQLLMAVLRSTPSHSPLPLKSQHLSSERVPQ
jgi:hypothetical protein